MLTVYLCVGMLVLLACTGAPIRRLATVRIRHVWLLWAALADQILVISVVPESDATALAVAHVASYLAAAAWVLLNRRLPGILLIGFGGGLNGLTISLNGGTLPASESALRAAGKPVDPGDFTNSGVLADPKLPWLGDVFATPSWMPGSNVFSVGDVLIWIGIVLFLWRTCRSVSRARHAAWAPAGYESRHADHRLLRKRRGVLPEPVHGPAGDRAAAPGHRVPEVV